MVGLTSVMAFLAFSSAFLHSWTASSTSACSWQMSASSFFFWLIRLVFCGQGEGSQGASNISRGRF